MKLRTKLKLTFCIMVILPLLLCSVAVTTIFQMQARSISQAYGTESDYSLSTLYSPAVLLGEMTEQIYQEVSAVADAEPEKLMSDDYLRDLDRKLQQKLSSLVVEEDGLILYSSSSYSEEELQELLPDYQQEEAEASTGIYRGGDYQCLIKTIQFTDGAGHSGHVYLITSLKQVIPEIRRFLMEAMAVIVLILVVTSLNLNLWIYNSVIRPLDKLRLATKNIKDGNLDFEVVPQAKDELGDLCNDFEEMRKRLKESAEEKLQSDIEEKELIRNISHDLKTPLTAIRGYVEGLRDGIADTPEKQQRYIQTIYNKVRDMDKLIDELTIYSRLDTNRIPYEFMKLDLEAYFADCVEEIGLELESRGIDLDYCYHSKTPVYVMADAEQLKRVVNNIISNSVKYMKPDRKGKIRIDIFDEGDYAHIVMADNGKGISCQDLPHIFDRFYRTDDSRNSKQGGSGIGLAIVKKIIEDHRGKIWAESVEGEGTTMHINLLKEFDKKPLKIEDKSKEVKKRERWLKDRKGQS